MEEKELLKIEINGIDFLNDDAEIDVDFLATFIQEKLDKAREEVLLELKDEIFFGEVAENLGEKISRDRIKNIVDNKLSKLTTK